MKIKQYILITLTIFMFISFGAQAKRGINTSPLFLNYTYQGEDKIYQKIH